MARILVLEDDAATRSFVQGALVSAGYEVEIGSADDLARASTFDALVADLHLGIRSGWFLPGAQPIDPGCPIVVISPFPAFLESIADRVAATISTPAGSDAIQQAVASAIARRRPTLAPPRDSLDSARRDAIVAEMSAPDSELMAIADLVARGTGTSIGIVTILDSQRQHFIGQVGLPSDIADAGTTPRSWSFCQHAVMANAPLLVEDASKHPLLATTPLAELGLVRAYAGMPIDVDGTIVGTVCALSDEPHVFDTKALATLQLAARLVSAHLTRKAKVRASSASLAPRSNAAPVSRAAPSGPEPSVGDLLDGKYWITTRLGGGGLSEVLLARDRMLGQLVAIKVMRKRPSGGRALAKVPRSGDEDLLREATALAKVRHPNIVQVQGWGRTIGGQIYLVLEYVEGRTLEDRLAASISGAEPFDVASALQIVRQLAGALATLHAAGIIHGDIKPENVMLDRTLDRAVLIDFGLALGNEDRGGTPGYSAPEQFAAETALRPTPALDVYALGAVAYAMLVGQAPFGWARGLTRVAAQRRGALTLPSTAHPSLPRAVDAVLVRALGVEPAGRFTSVLELTHALEEAFIGASPSLRPARVEQPAVPSSRGSTLRRVRAEVQRRLGAEAEEAVVEALAPSDRDVLRTGTEERDWYPTSALVAYLTAATNGDLDEVEDISATTTAQILPDLLKSAGVARTASTLLHVAAALVYRFHDWGKMTVVRSGSHDATLTLEMPEGYAPLMCRFITGALLALMRTATSQARVVEQWCMAAGAGACELKVTWTS